MVTLAPNEIVEEQVWAGEDVVEAFVANVDRIEMDLERTILMVEEQENVVLITIVPKWENENEDVEPHGHIDGNDILNFMYYYNLLGLEGGWGIFLVSVFRQYLKALLMILFF